MVTGCLLSIQNRFSKNNISHAQHLISQYTIVLIIECLIFVSNHLIFVSTFIDLILLLALNCTENKLFFNCFACFWPKGYQRGSLWKSYQNNDCLKQAMRKSYPPTGFETAAFVAVGG